MTGFSKVSPATTPTRASDRASSKPKKDPLGAFLAFKSSRVTLEKRQSEGGSSFQTTCISKHYDLNHQVYEAFRLNYYNLSSVVDTRSSSSSSSSGSSPKNHKTSNSNNNSSTQKETAKANFEWISSAFCLGWNFVETALLDLPHHGEFYSNDDPTLVKLRKRSSQAALEVTRLLQRILKLMDSMSLGGNQGMLLDASTSTEDPSKDPNAEWLLEHNRKECKRRLVVLKDLAKEQCENIQTYEAKRQSVAAKWNHASISSRSDTTTVSTSMTTTMTTPSRREGSTPAVGNHRGFKSKKADPPSSMDCDAMGACSRLFCPAALPDTPTQSQQPPKEHALPSPPSRNFGRSSLADSGDEISANGSDLAVLDSKSALPASVGLQIQGVKSDDAVLESKSFASPVPSTPETSTRNEAEKSGGGSSSIGSRQRRKKTPNSSKKSKNNNATNAAKKDTRYYANRLFGKKADVWQEHQKRKKYEEAQLQEALYQSEIDAAKEASIREEEMKALSFCGSGDSSFCDEPPTSRNKDGDHEDYDLRLALYLSGLDVNGEECCGNTNHQIEEEKRDDADWEGPSSSSRQETAERGTVIVKGSPVRAPVRAPPGAVQRSQKDPYDSLKVLKACCRKDFERLKDQAKIVVTRIATYQGRIQGSTNGCTVIAPLLCTHYFKTDTKRQADGTPSRLSDETITSVIDTESPSLLPTIRKSLGVSKNAFLIPHDAHEHLVESKHMSRDQFVTVCGGNILEEGHLGALIKELSKVLPDGKRLGATFFFHQHVIAILQLRGCDDDPKALSFDVIDSLPSKHTLPPPANSVVPDKLRLPNCARIFCKDVSALKATLKWYACSVFTADNEEYIDKYQWDEKLTDFDPRVFQAFLWKEI